MGGRGGSGGGKGGGMRRGSAEANAFVKKALASYRQPGGSLSKTAKELGVSASTVAKHLTSAGVQLHPRGGRPK